MSFSATSTKERFLELQKNPLFFCKFCSTIEQDNAGYYYSIEQWVSCDPTINISFSEHDLPYSNISRRLFVVGKQIYANGTIDDKKEDDDVVEFEITEFDSSNYSDWVLVFNDCLYNYKSGNHRHCHMALFWSLYITKWEKDVVYNALSSLTKEASQTVCSYISANIFAFSVEKQYVLVELFKIINPNLQTQGVTDVEDALKELAPSFDFSSYGFYEKIDYLLSFGKNPNEREHLNKLYKSSRNGIIFFKYWMEHVGKKFFNYNYLEFVFSYVDFHEQLLIIKRYLHDVRIKLIDTDFSLIKNMRDIKYNAYVDIRYFIYSPGDNIDLTASMFCDTLLTLENSKGEKIQDFNGILDFAVGHSNKAYPQIDLGVKYLLPICDGGLMHNKLFYGFIHYSIQYYFDDTKLTGDNLNKTVDFLLGKFAQLQYHNCCKGDQNRELTESEAEKCRKVIKELIYTTQNGKRIKTTKKSECPLLLFEPVKPFLWRKKSDDSNPILSLFVENIESKEYIKIEDINIDRLKQSLIMWGERYRSFSFINGKAPNSLVEKVVAYHITMNYYTPLTIEVYPNKGMIYSSKKSLLGVWDKNGIKENQSAEYVAQMIESPIVYENTFSSLKEMFPEGEVKDDHIKIPYDNDVLNNIKAFYHYRDHEYDPQIGYSKVHSRFKEFLTPKRIQGTFYCTPKVAESREKVSSLPFYWCRSDECFYNMLAEQTLNKQKEWREYTLYHAAEIIGYKLIDETDKGNVPKETVSNFAANVRQAERMYARLICRTCGHMIFSTRGSLLNGSRFFACVNSLCPQHDKEIYLSQCNHCKTGLIDSRDSKKCENGWVICPSCLACCNDELFNRLIASHRRNGWVPVKLLESEGKGHNNKGLFFCPKCGSELKYITIEENVRREDGTEELVIHDVLGCPHCMKSYEKEHDKFIKPKNN